jgi:DNA-binding transcriptional ArsR family regulator
MHIFEVMAEPIRRRLVEVLASGEHHTGDLEALIMLEFGVGRSAVYHHLKLLNEHGYVIKREEWRMHSYRLDDGFVPRLSKEVRRLRRRWDARTGWSSKNDPLSPKALLSIRGYRGHGADPDNPWRRHAEGARGRDET